MSNGLALSSDCGLMVVPCFARLGPGSTSGLRSTVSVKLHVRVWSRVKVKVKVKVTVTVREGLGYGRGSAKGRDSG